MRAIICAMVMVGLVGSVFGCETRVAVRHPVVRERVVVEHPVYRGDVIVR
jgi:hypothetical protein